MSAADYNPNLPETKVPALPPERDVVALARAIKQLLEVREGQRGSPLDQNVTWRRLIEAGIAEVIIDGQRIGAPSPGNVIVPPAGSDGDDDEEDLTPPPKPLGLDATAAIQTILLSWDVPAGYNNLAFTEVWRAAEDNRDAAVQVGSTSGYLYTDTVGPNSPLYFYWVRFVSRANIQGEFSDSTSAQTSPDPEWLLDLLEGKITQSQLHQDLSERIDAVSTLQEQIVTLSAGIGDQFDSAKIWYFDTSVESWTGNGSPTTVSGWLRPASHATDAYVVSPAALAVNGDSYPQVKFRIRKVGAPSWEGLLWWRPNASTPWSIDGRMSFAEPAFDDDGIAVVTLNAPWTGTIDAIRLDPSSSSSLTDFYELDWVAIGRAAPGASVAALQQEAAIRASETGELFAKYTVKIDHNGYVSGYGLASEENDGTITSTFAVRADAFYIASPAGPGVAPTMPFIVITTPTVIDGEEVLPGVYMRSATIMNGAIKAAQIGLLQVDNGHIANCNVDKLIAGQLGVGQWISSQNYDPGATGWRINADGVAEFSDAVIRGGVFASYGAIAGINIAETSIYSSNYVEGVSGFFLHSSGLAEFNGVTVRGTVVASHVQAGATITSPVITGGTVSAGVFYGGAHTASYAWPATGIGFHLSANGLLLGNANTGSYAQINADGSAAFNNVFARGNIEASSLKAGTAMIDTLHILGGAVTVPAAASGNTFPVSQFFQTACSVAVATHGSPYFCQISFAVTVPADIGGDFSGGTLFLVRILRSDGVAVRTVQVTVDKNQSWPTHQVITLPFADNSSPVGTLVYSAQIAHAPRSGWLNGGTVEDSNIFLVEARR